MLDVIRKNSKSVFISLLFGLLIIAFVIELGVKNQSPLPIDTSSAKELSKPILKIDDYELTGKELRYSFGGIEAEDLKGEKGFFYQSYIKRYLLDIVSRQSLVAVAHQMGLSLSDDAIIEKMKQGGHTNESVQNLMRRTKFSMDELLNFFRQQLLSSGVSDLIKNTQTLSLEAAKQMFRDEKTGVKLQYVKFIPHAEDLEVSEAVVSSYAKQHTDVIKKKFEENKKSYETADPKVRFQAVWVVSDKFVETEEWKKVKAALGAAKKEYDFSAVKLLPASKTIVKWVVKGASGLGKDAEEKLFAAKKGDIVGPLSTSYGNTMIKVIDVTSKKLELSDTELDLATEEYRKEKAPVLAKEQADRVALQLKAGKTLVDMFPLASDPKAPKDPSVVKVDDTSFVARSTYAFSMIGDSKELVQAAFSPTAKVNTFWGPLLIQGNYVVAVLTEKQTANMKEFEKNENELIVTYREKQANSYTKALVYNACKEAVKSNKIKIFDNIWTKTAALTTANICEMSE